MWCQQGIWFVAECYNITYAKLKLQMWAGKVDKAREYKQAIFHGTWTPFRFAISHYFNEDQLGLPSFYNRTDNAACCLFFFLVFVCLVCQNLDRAVFVSIRAFPYFGELSISCIVSSRMPSRRISGLTEFSCSRCLYC